MEHFAFFLMLIVLKKSSQHWRARFTALQMSYSMLAKFTCRACVFVLERVGAKGPRGNWGRFAGVLKKLHDGHVILYLHAGHENWEYHARHVIPSLHARHAILRLHAGHVILSLHARHVILSLHAGHVLDVSYALLGTSISQTTAFKAFLNSIFFKIHARYMLPHGHERVSVTHS